MAFHRVELRNSLHLFFGFAFVPAYNPWSLGQVLHQITTGFDAARRKTNGGFEGLLYFSSQEETAAFLSLCAISTAQPALVFSILRRKLNRSLGIRDRPLVVMLFVVGPRKPIVHGCILRSSLQRGRQYFLCLDVPARSKMRLRRLQRLHLGLG